jgi:amino acid adenylation domain-containing protein
MSGMQVGSIEGYRLSPQQKWLWRQINNSEQNGWHNPYWVQAEVEIAGPLDLAILQQAIQQVVTHHEILRTTFTCLPGMTAPLQVIQPPAPIAIAIQNLTSLPTSEQSIQLDTLWQEMLQAGDAIATPLQLCLASRSKQHQSLLVRLSALNGDRATLTHFVQSLSEAYRALWQQQPWSCEPLQYADIAEWQQELLESGESQPGRQFWQSLPTPTTPKLPFESNTNSPQELQPRSLSLEINNALSDRLKLAAQTAAVPLSTWLLASWQLLLWRFSRQELVTVGLHSNCRTYTELETALGPLTKTLPFSLAIEDNWTFGELLQRVQAAESELQKWQEYFEPGTEHIDPEARLTSIQFEWQSLPAAIASGDIIFSIRRQYSCVEPFRLKLFSCEQDTLGLELHYDANQLALEDVQRWADNFACLLESSVAQPETSIARLDLLGDRERQQLLGFNATQSEYACDRYIHQLIEAQAAKTPDRVAVVCANQQLTYEELNVRSNQLAHYLQQQGVQPETVVGICCDRSLEMIVALLGVLKAGGAYLPLDPTMPAERLVGMLQDAQVDILLTQTSLSHPLETAVTQTIYLDQNWTEIAQAPAKSCTSSVTGENLAYVIYTSGSTGKPKGVAIAHQSLLNYVYGILPQLDLPDQAHFALISTFAADLGNTAIFPTLCTGGCLHIIPQEVAIDPVAWAEYCQQYPIDCLKIVPSHLAALLSGAEAASVLPRHRLVLGGETLSWDLVETVQKLAPDCLILNHYGPTEATVGVLTYSVPPIPSRSIAATVPIGKAIANTQMYVLDSYLQPVPLGVAGELYIGGDSLARGYLHHPEMTAERFVLVGGEELGVRGQESEARSQKSGGIRASRLYKTGDWVRYLPDGNLEFLGRADNQVKIRGYRIELGEIESVLRRHPNVEQAIAVAREIAGEPKLVAYYVLKQSQTVELAELQEFLRSQLPDYMVPTVWVPLPNLPLTPNGKIDRQALPAPELTSNCYVAPRNTTEAAIAAIWQEVLKVERVGIHDNFFALGGHSLLATQVMSRLRQELQVELPLHHLFESPTIADLAVVITQNLATPTDDEMLAQMLAELEQLSEGEAQIQLVQEEVHS